MFQLRYGRVNYVLARRLELLREVARLQESLDVPGDVSYTCETAGYFYLYQVRSPLKTPTFPTAPRPLKTTIRKHALLPVQSRLRAQA